MKKLLSVMALLLTFCMGANAQEEESKKTWDFTQGWSDETKADLNADANWVSNRTNAETGETTGWKDNAKMSGTLTANGNEIAELKGLVFGTAGLGNNGNYLLDPASFRMARKNMEVSFPKLKNGQTITIVGRSANKDATDRGIAPKQDYIKFLTEESSPQTDNKCLFLGSNVAGSEGTYTFVWKVETESEDAVDVTFQLTPSGGIDFTLFMIDQGDAPAVKEAQPIAYLYSGDLDTDFAYIYLSGDNRFALTEINVDETTETAETLMAKLEDGKTNRFQAVVVSPTIGADNAFLPEIKKLVAFMPMLNLNPNLYEALGYGKAVKTETNILTVADVENPNAAFEGLDITEGLALLTDGTITGVELGDYFAADDVIATAGETVAMHIHNAKRNAYMLLPLTIEDMAAADQDIIAALIPNALQVVVDTKKDVQAVGTPVITPTQENGYTTVTITAANSKKIFYTIDGTDPTEESTVYTEALTFTAPTTVKAFATGDGYTHSKIAEKSIVIMVQAAAPEIAVTREAGKSTITLTTNEEVDIYFNFTGSSKVAESQKYDVVAPIELTEPTYITFLASGGNYLDSPTTTQFIGVDGIDQSNIRWDVVLHMGAEKEEWSEVGSDESRSSKVNYMFGKSAKSMYTDEQIGTEIVKDEEGNDVEVPVFKKVEPMEVTNVSGTWKAVSYGQVMTWENPTPGKNVGEVGSNCPEFASDHMPVNGVDGVTNYMLNFKGKASGEPYNASLETVNPVAGPFDVIIYFNNGSAGSEPKVNVETSENGTDWTMLGELATVDVRLMKRTKLSYEGEDAVYVRLAHVGGNSAAQVFDIYVMKNGEKSQQYSEEAMGVSEVKSDQRAKMVGIYSINGVRTQQLTRGLNIVVNADGSVRKVMVK